VNSKQAIAKLRKALGPKFAYRIDQFALGAEERAEKREQWQLLKRIADEAVAARKARYAEILKDPVYLDLHAKALMATEAAEIAARGLNAKRVTVGRDIGWAFSVVADGNNWSEVVEKVCSPQICVDT
jgi:alpha-L-arabinofuranosidase